MKLQLRQTFEQLIMAGPRTWWQRLLWLLLLPVSRCYRQVVQLRHSCYDHGWIRSVEVSVPLVLSVGNIAAGGTGKTPLIDLLLSELKEHGQIGVVTRGYQTKTRKESSPRLFCWKEQSELSTSSDALAAMVGDETLLLARCHPSVLFAISRQRVVAAQLLAKQGCQALLIDDGFQHRQLRRTIDLVVVDGADPLAAERFLPYGGLRDLPERLAAAELLVAIDNGAGLLPTIHEELRRWSSAPIVLMKKKLHAVHLAGNQLLSVDELLAKESALWCGVGRPDRLVAQLKRLNVQLLGTLFFPDHQLDRQKLSTFASNMAAAGANLLLCTEKDWVKLPSDIDLPLPIGRLESHLVIVEGEQIWRDFLEKCGNLIKKCCSDRPFGLSRGS